VRPPMRFAVGDEVVWTSCNYKGAKRYTVVKVGRELVYIDGDDKPYRISNGSRHDKYGNERIRSLAAYEWDERVHSALAYFAANGLRQDFGSRSEEWLVWAADMLRAATPPPERTCPPSSPASAAGTAASRTATCGSSCRGAPCAGSAEGS